ncbi:MAG: endo-1,4-beta-xylanase, partial [Bacteroidales bacterium]|nr:endo-1,4-beta-xylanase [Bacteroidales bacterium]
MKKFSTLILMSALLLSVFSCSKVGDEMEYFDKPTDVVNPNPPLPPVDFDKTSLGELAAKQGIKLGVAVTRGEYFQNDQVPEIIKREFKSVTFGNEMKHDGIVGSNGKFNFSTADEMVGWMNDCGVELFGHTLGWHSQQQRAYLNSVIDKAAADNSESIFQSNWNFEEGSVDGYSAAGFSVTEDYADVFAGTYAAKSSAAGSSITVNAPIEAGTPYILSFWAKGPEGAAVSFASGDGQNASTTVSEGWYKYSVTVPTKRIGEFSYKITAD